MITMIIVIIVIIVILIFSKRQFLMETFHASYTEDQTQKMFCNPENKLKVTFKFSANYPQKLKVAANKEICLIFLSDQRTVHTAVKFKPSSYEGKIYLGPFPDKAEGWFLVVEDARLDGGEVRVLKELTLLQAALPKSLKLRAHHSALLFLTSSPHSLSLPGLGSARFGGARGTGCARGSSRGKGGRLACLPVLVPVPWNPRTGRGRRILGVTSFSCPASNPKLWKFQAPLQGLRVDTSPHRYDRITRTRVVWPGY